MNQEEKDAYTLNILRTYMPLIEKNDCQHREVEYISIAHCLDCNKIFPGTLKSVSTSI